MVTGLAAGSVIAGYRVESRIGVGGMAMVFRARDEALGRIVALKVLAPAVADDAAFRERFIRESRAAAVVDHPHIIPVYGAGEFGGVLYIAMRFVAGGDLRALLKREGPLPPSRAAFLLSPLASALDAGHAAGLVHRDVKPANVLIDTSPGRPDHLYLSDFGLAKGNATTGLTGTGQFLGTLDYCAPEQIGGKPARPQTDQYALGCVAYTMLTGTVPFPRDEVTAVLWAHMSEPAPPVSALRPDLSAAVDAVLARAMAKDPDERYPTCTEFADEVRTALGLSAYATPSSGYTATGPGLPQARAVELADLPSPATSLLVPPSPVPVPPTALDQVSPPREEPVPGSTAPSRAATQSDSPVGFADTTGQAVPQPGSSPATETRHRPAVNPAGRRIMLAAAAVVVVAGGVTAAVLALSSPGSPPGSVDGSPPASATSGFPTPFATLAEPGAVVPNGVAFESDSTLITTDTAGYAFSWDIASGTHTPTNTAGAVVLARQSPVADGLELIRSSLPNVIYVWVSGTQSVVATLAVPSSTLAEADAISQDGAEAAVTDSNGNTYVWKIVR
jgi:serine/threonine-protein kinase